MTKTSLQNLQSKYTGIYVDQDVVDLIRSRLSRNLVAMVPQIGNAASDALGDIIPDAEQGTPSPDTVTAGFPHGFVYYVRLGRPTGCYTDNRDGD